MRETPEELIQTCGISAKYGFLPDTDPLQRLPDIYYDPWEALAENLPKLIANDAVRSKIDQLPILGISQLHTDAEWRRAYVVLGFLTHAYIWGGERPAERLPPQLTCPFLAVSEHLGLPPTATFSTLSLWNFGLQTPGSDRTSPENLRSLVSFTNTKDEEWFCMISTAIEAKGAPLILTILRCIQAVDDHNDKLVLSCLQTLTNGIHEIENLLKRMHEKNDPQVFYHNIRPFCAGTKGMAAAGLPNGVFYDEGGGRGQWRQYSGGSNAQSSLIQLFDIFLAVDHYATGGGDIRRPVSQYGGAGPKGYLHEMRNYMPRPHRKFLARVARMRNLREYISRTTTSTELQAAYNGAVTAVVRLRNSHIQIVARYIVMPSRSPPAQYIVQRKGANLATACSTQQHAGEMDEDASVTRQLHGTGGTSVMPFLKRTRDETREAMMRVS
ncbi:indoleamine 2,3-dioxygenase [Cladophialophora psammophila CBS 110553]|uniref:Indoleamine 2,3-dioxygenase n=1 Tax=Cladophialophora psammophila CBS 110553 TaxID=1182543 RepID=W9WTT1_9EURO|nr:indoleamine 2,3-dioxygenase [Cladophialophora psammophila CBS 110553]EXJ71328.1 indoleamine 2,3-dioxygenase [Cladophialophora psammophila CBS 110553]